MADNQKSMTIKRPERVGISKNVYILTIAVVAILGFTAGLRSNDIMAAIGPMFGYKTTTDTIDLSAVERTYQNLEANYNGKLDTQKLIDGASSGLVAAVGDPYTVFMNANQASAFNNDLSGTIGGGIGAEIGVRNGQPTIIELLPNNPADQAGLMVGDIITAVNGKSAKNWDATTAAGAIRGNVGTTVQVTVLRGNDTKNFSIVRAEVNDPSVQSSVQNGVGIMTISRFDSDTGDLARQAAQSFKQQNVKSVILDLRGNGGGYLTAAQDVAGLWLNNQVVVSERTDGKVVDTLRSGNDAILEGLPTVVLVNGDSASASEIVAGALQDHHVATLVGEKTFGKGSVQKVIDLGSGTLLKVTVALWYTPDGKNINKQGITPNQIVGLSAADANAGRDPQLDAAKKYLGVS